MNKVSLAIRELHRSENDLATELLRTADRHKVDHEIFHVARDIAGWSQQHVRELARAGHDYDLDLDLALALSERCHPQTLRQLRWANAKLKEIAAQTVITD
ncbi:hypothetical protein K3M35_23420 [Rhodococcus sp. DMU2021]|uniref:hypothetical protein n=1 Tax=Rhodococcus sp. DMU2021 TaxID=2866997 RepID=UPI001C7DD345|nr:hypothetical protein [Rhodococcus sp. DMU2021]MBX4171569.1 hypothetical protein [Rhodococcus sp. DMU2021]